VSDDRQIGLHNSQLWDFLELVPLTLVVADTEGIIRAASSKIEEQFGHSRDELLGQNISILTGAQHAPRLVGIGEQEQEEELFVKLPYGVAIALGAVVAFAMIRAG